MMSNTNEINNNNEEYFIRIRGIPFSSSREDIVKFFKGINIKDGVEGVFFEPDNGQGRPNGVAFVQLLSFDDYNKSFEKHMKYMGHRYIEVKAATRKELEMHQKKSQASSLPNDFFIRIRGIPFSSTVQDIINFFKGLKIAANGVRIPMDYHRKGQAYIQFVSVEDAGKAMSFHKKTMGHRYIEVFRSSKEEFDEFMPSHLEESLNSSLIIHRTFDQPWKFNWSEHLNQEDNFHNNPPEPSYCGSGESSNFRNVYSSPQDSNLFVKFQYRNEPNKRERIHRPYSAIKPPQSKNFNRPMSFIDSSSTNQRSPSVSHFVLAQGFPNYFNESDIEAFFQDVCRPINIKIIRNLSGSSTCEAKVEFATYNDAVAAMVKDFSFSGGYKIELFLCSKNVNNENNHHHQQQQQPQHLPPPQHPIGQAASTVAGNHYQTTPVSSPWMPSYPLYSTVHSSLLSGEPILYAPQYVSYCRTENQIPVTPQTPSSLSSTSLRYYQHC